jgi:hypothetical protein
MIPCMRLRSLDGERVDLLIASYQYPSRRGSGNPGFDWDANWLMIRGDVQLADGRSWHFEEPYLQASEARALEDWMRGVLAGSVMPSTFEVQIPDKQLLFFTEPHLALSLASRDYGRAQLRFHFSLEALPPWQRGLPGEFALYAFFVLLDITPEGLSSAVADWARDVAQFPPR